MTRGMHTSLVSVFSVMLAHKGPKYVEVLCNGSRVQLTVSALSWVN
jgi:hypothetical protein